MTGLKKSFDLLIKAFKAYKGSSSKGSSYKDTMGDPGIARMDNDGEAVVNVEEIEIGNREIEDVEKSDGRFIIFYEQRQSLSYKSI